MKHLISLTGRPAWLGLWIGFALLLAACGPAGTTVSSPVASAAASETSEYSADATPAPSATRPQAAIPDTGDVAVQAVNDPKFGQVLATSAGLTLYANTVDSPEQLRCTTNACTDFWPPYLVSGQPTAIDGIPGSLGTVTRPDGSLQLTYNRQPLYTFYLDKAPGDAKGNGFTDLGGTWNVVHLMSAQAGNSPSPAPTSGSGGYHY